MQNFIAGLLLASCAVPLAAGSMTIASSLIHEGPSHHFTNLDAEPLWTSEVKKININEQAYERLPALVAPETLLAEARQKSAPATSNQSVDNQQQLAQAAETFNVNEEAKSWCAAKYRSYSAEDNTYQPYGGGSRKPCIAPAEMVGVATVQTPSATNEDIGASEHVQWCTERYSSYRIEDNSYQPFSGPRKKCLPTEQQSASNNYAANGQQLYQ